MKTSKLKNSKDLYTAILFILPLLIFITLFVLVPILGTIINSFFQDIAFKKLSFVFLQNYHDILSDPGYWQAFRFTLLFTLIAVPLEIILGLCFALILHRESYWSKWLRICVLIPWAIPAAISARIWELILNYSYGLANALCLFLHITKEPVHWLGTDIGAFSALVLADVWKTTPFVAILLLAGLSAIPKELYDQAKVDGAFFYQRFIHITIHLLRPVLVVSLLFRTADTLRIFDIVYVLTHGGPGGATTSFSLYGFKYFLVSDFGRGSTVSVLLFLIALLVSILYIKFGRFYEDIK